MDDTGAAHSTLLKEPGPLHPTAAVSLKVETFFGWYGGLQIGLCLLNLWKDNLLPISAGRQHFHHVPAFCPRWADGRARRGHLHSRCHQALKIKLIGCGRGNIFMLFKNESRGYSCIYGWEPPVAQLPMLSPSWWFQLLSPPFLSDGLFHLVIVAAVENKSLTFKTLSDINLPQVYITGQVVSTCSALHG